MYKICKVLCFWKYQGKWAVAVSPSVVRARLVQQRICATTCWIVITYCSNKNHFSKIDIQFSPARWPQWDVVQWIFPGGNLVKGVRNGSFYRRNLLSARAKKFQLEMFKFLPISRIATCSGVNCVSQDHTEYLAGGESGAWETKLSKLNRISVDRCQIQI